MTTMAGFNRSRPKRRTYSNSSDVGGAEGLGDQPTIDEDCFVPLTGPGDMQ